MNQQIKKSPKLLSQQIRKVCYKTLGTSVKNSPMSPPFLLSSSLESYQGPHYLRQQILYFTEKSLKLFSLEIWQQKNKTAILRNFGQIASDKIASKTKKPLKQNSLTTFK